MAGNQTSTLVITEVAPEDFGRYYFEVNVLQKDPELGNGTRADRPGRETNGWSQK